MQIVMTSIIFTYGLMFGSFFNVVGIRFPTGQALSKGRSHCPTCHTALKPRDLFPLLSYLSLAGKCRYCQSRISPLYPLIECVTALLFAVSYLTFGWSMAFLAAIMLVSMAAILTVSDLHYMIIPDKVLIIFLGCFGVLRVMSPLQPWHSSLTGAAVAMVLLALIIIVSRGGMGGGDMKLMGVLGVLLGLQSVLLTFFLATLIGTIISMGLLGFGIIDRKQPIPFGPYILTAAVITMFVGEDLVTWYLNFF
ncbi:A24 family peptidase [Thalassobacillus sp. CUG 92003]|uniref:prepilin peptidase n=1 Tax=Thalassobacillus sp. CUG 92003 TaxID=2736641 RepID=UPI0015E794EE|nr:A24 family peptidase [Thalassobacillus sp. CUG 92003]